jgi:hypothetical protein
MDGKVHAVELLGLIMELGLRALIDNQISNGQFNQIHVEYSRYLFVVYKLRVQSC